MVVVVDVVVATKGATQPATGTVVPEAPEAGGHSSGTVVVVVAVISTEDAFRPAGERTKSARATKGRANTDRRTLHTLLMQTTPEWAPKQRYWRDGIQPDSQTDRPQDRHLVCHSCSHRGIRACCVGIPRITVAQDIWDGELHGEIDVRRVQPYEALKQYTCPGCNQEIPAGKGHVVAVPRDAPDLRRHWHKACWERRNTRTKR